jgi:hypothetical protein
MIKPYSTHFFQLTTKPCFDTFFNRLQNKILNPDADGWGEICSRNIFMGYHHDEDATRKAFSEDGEYWYKSGDIGRIDEDGFMLLRGRIKELIVVSNVVLIGEAKKYLTVLLTVRVDVDADTLLPTDRLEPSATFWCKKRGTNNVRTIDDFINGPHAENSAPAFKRVWTGRTQRRIRGRKGCRSSPSCPRSSQSRGTSWDRRSR